MSLAYRLFGIVHDEDDLERAVVRDEIAWYKRHDPELPIRGGVSAVVENLGETPGLDRLDESTLTRYAEQIVAAFRGQP